MKGVLAPVYFTHLCLLIAAMHILYADHITKSNLEQARHHLELFYVQFSDLYGKLEHKLLYSHVVCARKMYVADKL